MSQYPLSANFLLSGGDADAITGKFLPTAFSGMSTATSQPTEHSHTIPLAIDLLDTATACSTKTFLGSISPAVTKRLKEVFLTESQEQEPKLQLKSESRTAIPENRLAPAIDVDSINEGLHLQLTSALRTNNELVANIKTLREENDELRKTSILTRGSLGVQRNLNATSINLMEEQTGEDQDLDARLIVSLRTTITSLEQQNRTLEEQIKELQSQLLASKASRAEADTAVRENEIVARSLHQQLEGSVQKISVLTKENDYKNKLIEAMQDEMERIKDQLNNQANANLAISQYMSKAAASKADGSTVNIIDLQGKLEQCRLMNRQYEESMATLLDEQKATGDLLTTLMDRTEEMSSRLSNIEKQVVAVTRDRLVDIYRRRLESMIANHSK